MTEALRAEPGAAACSRARAICCSPRLAMPETPSFLTLGVSGMASLGLQQIARAREQAAAPGSARNASVILLWLDGGPSHLDLYDMKPDAPAEYRGLWRPIKTRVPGFDVTELFPRQARVTDK